MTAETHSIATRLAASPWFPVGGKTTTRDGVTIAVSTSVGHVEVDGNTVSITVTDPDGAKREYRAVVQLVAEDAHTEP